MVPIGEVDDVHALAEILGCRVGILPMSYLGMPLEASHKSPLIWNPIQGTTTVVLPLMYHHTEQRGKVPLEGDFHTITLRK